MQRVGPCKTPSISPEGESLLSLYSRGNTRTKSSSPRVSGEHHMKLEKLHTTTGFRSQMISSTRTAMAKISRHGSFLLGR